jgi:hypothetical protein
MHKLLLIRARSDREPAKMRACRSAWRGGRGLGPAGGTFPSRSRGSSLFLPDRPEHREVPPLDPEILPNASGTSVTRTRPATDWPNQLEAALGHLRRLTIGNASLTRPQTRGAPRQRWMIPGGTPITDDLAAVGCVVLTLFRGHGCVTRPRAFRSLGGCGYLAVAGCVRCCRSLRCSRRGRCAARLGWARRGGCGSRQARV